MNIRVEVRPDHKRTARAIKALRRRTHGRYRLVGSLLCLAGLVLAMIGFDAGWVTLLLAEGACLMFLPDLTVWLYIRRRRRVLGRPGTIELTDRGACSSNPLATVELAWDMFDRVEETEEFWLLRTGKNEGIALPKEHLAPEQRAEFRAFLAGHGLLSA